MKKILWLPGWYPSKLDPFSGDFIQRHARAVSLFLPVTLIYVIKDENGLYTNDVLAETTVQGALHETIVYYKPLKTGIATIDKLLSSAKYFSVYRKYIRKYIAQSGRPDLIHVHVPFKAGVLARWYKKKYGIPFIVTEHWCGYNKLNPHNYFTRSAMFRQLTRKIFESADLVTMVCESNRKELHELFNIRKSVITVNVADSNLFYFDGNDPSDPFTFIHVSSLTSQKNMEGILEAFAELKRRFQNWRCIIVGRYSNALIDQAKQSGLENFLLWTGELPYESVALQMHKAHCMVMFSRYENSPCTIIEALSTGMPVIASRIGGIPEIIDQSNGLLVESENIPALSQALEQMMKNYKAYNRSEIAARARTMFSYETVGAQIAGLYDSEV